MTDQEQDLQTTPPPFMARPVAEVIGPQVPQPWRFWPAMGFSMAVLAVFFVLQAIVSIIHVVIETEVLDNELSASFSEMPHIGLCVSIAVLVSCPAGMILVYVFARLCKTMSVKEYLGLTMPSPGQVAKWLLLMIAFIALSAISAIILKQHASAEFLVNACKSAVILPLFLFSFIILAPVFEELFFRGFLFTSIQYTVLGTRGAILLSSLLWAIIHTQYDWFGMVTILTLGIMLGIARARTNSTYLVILMHIFQNFIAISAMMIELHISAG